MEEVLLFTKFFFRLSIHALVAKIQNDKIVRWCRDCDFLRPVFSASRVQYISDLHSKFALRPHHVWKYGSNIFKAQCTNDRGRINLLYCGWYERRAVLDIWQQQQQVVGNPFWWSRTFSTRSSFHSHWHRTWPRTLPVTPAVKHTLTIQTDGGDL